MSCAFVTLKEKIFNCLQAAFCISIKAIHNTSLRNTKTFFLIPIFYVLFQLENTRSLCNKLPFARKRMLDSPTKEFNRVAGFFTNIQVTTQTQDKHWWIPKTLILRKDRTCDTLRSEFGVVTSTNYLRVKLLVLNNLFNGGSWKLRSLRNAVVVQLQNILILIRLHAVGCCQRVIWRDYSSSA